MRTETRPVVEVERTAPPFRPASWLSGCIAIVMAGAAVAGLTVHGLYHEGPWAREALRGGDLVTLAIVVPALVLGMWFSHRGDTRGTLVWLGALGYSVYNYAFYVFGSNFNAAFLAHIAIFTASIFAIALVAPLAEQGGFRFDRTERFVGAFLVLVGIAQGGLWVVVILRNAITGALIANVPVAGQHLVFALDLSLMMPALIVGGVLLLKRNPLAFVVSPAVAVAGTLVVLNLLIAALVQHAAGVPGVKAFAPESVFLVATMLTSAVLLLRAHS